MLCWAYIPQSHLSVWLSHFDTKVGALGMLLMKLHVMLLQKQAGKTPTLYFGSVSLLVSAMQVA